MFNCLTVQRVQNAGARLVNGQSTRHHIHICQALNDEATLAASPLPEPVRGCTADVDGPLFMAHIGKRPSYISNATTLNFTVPRIMYDVIRQAFFSISGHIILNQLPFF